MSEAAEREARRRTATLADDQRAWLEGRLAEYAELLAYLREH